MQRCVLYNGVALVSVAINTGAFLLIGYALSPGAAINAIGALILSTAFTYTIVSRLVFVARPSTADSTMTLPVARPPYISMESLWTRR